MKKIFNLLICIGICALFGLNQRTLNLHASTNSTKYVLTEDVHNQYLDEILLESTTYSSNINEYHNYLTSYFDNLTYNLGMNYKGSCGYVGIGMLLSYYDTFLNDSIIDENYDVNSIASNSNMIIRRNSPGVLRDIIANPINISDSSYGANLTAQEYYNHMSSISNQSLHAKLITIGSSKGYYNFNDDSMPAGLIFNEIISVLENYLEDEAELANSEYSITYAGTNVRNFVIQNVSNNIPVLLGITGIFGGHIVIAYDYDSDSDLIYCHFGWGANKTHITIESESFLDYAEALTLSIDSSHSHSNNYGIITIMNNIPTTSYYCFDSSYITLVNHSYTSSYSFLSSSSHLAYCECGDTKSLPHTMLSGICTFCGYSHTHDYSTWTYYNKRLHIKACDCGEHGSMTRAHAIRSTDIGRYVRCIECNYLLDINSDIAIIIYSNSLFKMVSLNGSYILPNGIVVLVDADIDAYFAGTLVFHNTNNLSLK